MTDQAVADMTHATGRRAPEIAAPRALCDTREEPVETALVQDLDSHLRAPYRARRGGRPLLRDFAALGTYDVSVPRANGDGFAAVVEFKWWGPPGRRGGAPAKRHELLWDIFKVACSVAAGRSELGYLTVLAPDATWGLPHLYSQLFAGGEWSIDDLCLADRWVMQYFDDRHYGVTHVPSRIRFRHIATQAITDPVDGSAWRLRSVGVEPSGPPTALARVTPRV